MKKTELSKSDISMILESLKYSRHKFEEYQKYPTHEYKQKRIHEVDEVMSKVYKIQQEMKL